MSYKHNSNYIYYTNTQRSMSNAPCPKCEVTIKFINVDCVIKTKATHLPKDNNNPTAHIYPGIVISFLCLQV